MSKQTIWFKDGYNLKVDCIDDLRRNSGYLTMKVNIDKVRMQHQHCILKVNINCKGCEKKLRKLLLKIHVVDAVSIDIEQEKVTVLGNVDPNELIKQIKKSGKHAEICSVQKGVKNNANGGESNGNVNGGKKNGNANANSGENNGNNGNASGGKKNGNENASGGKNNGNGNANGGENNGNGNGNASGGKKNGNGNASGGVNNGNRNMAQMVPIGGGGYRHQVMPMQMQPYSHEQLHHMMMNQQQQHMNMYPQAMNMYPSTNYMPPPPIQSRSMADPTQIFNDENVQSCRIM